MAGEMILLAEDDRDLRLLLEEILVAEGYAVRAVASGREALRSLDDPGLDLVVSDMVMPGAGGRDVLQGVRERRRDLNLVIITAFGSIDSAIELVKEGAFDYLTKPFANDELLLSVQRALEESRLRREAAAAGRGFAPPPGFVATSGPMRALMEMVAKVGRSPLPVLVTGETGTGKELVARAVHTASGRDPFVALNCATLPENLLESELFGHERGAFSGADRAKPGLFEVADGGTLFLDEVGELPGALQPKLLRALEEGEIRRVGATRSTRVDVRVVAATNRDLDEEVAGARFRGDLYWRLNGLALHVTPLRERPADIPVLVEHFLARFAAARGSDPSTGPRFDAQAMDVLRSYAWPGNVRELRSVVERAATLAEGGILGVEALPDRVRDGGLLRVSVSEAGARHLPLAEVERAYILEILRITGGNKSRAAEILRLDRKTLYRKLEQYATEARSV
ncbi:MAG TPA: sigma-54 dependent transcriptional regulator [Longimicrobiales bacterium]|nr:sigma-54 dependent transcriptional regulator [Longimicrobiales bacterium]